MASDEDEWEKYYSDLVEGVCNISNQLEANLDCPFKSPSWSVDQCPQCRFT
jgi:hypothetical protein